MCPAFNIVFTYKLLIYVLLQKYIYLPTLLLSIVQAQFASYVIFNYDFFSENTFSHDSKAIASCYGTSFLDTYYKH